MRSATAPKATPPRPESPAESIGEVIQRIMLRARERAQALPCYRGTEAGDVHLAVDLCVAAGAVEKCEHKRDENCPRLRERRPLLALADRMARAQIPGAVTLEGKLRSGAWVEPSKSPAIAELLAATMPGRRRPNGDRQVQALPLRDTAPLRIVRAFIAGRAAEVDVGASRPQILGGDEWALVMGGAVGVGKTVAACAPVLEPDARGMLFATAPDLVDADRPAVSLHDAKEADLLVLDDLGMEYLGANAYGAVKLAEVLVERHAHRRRTIVTTNLDRKLLTDRYGDRLADRLREGAIVVGFAGSSLRGGAK